MLLRNKRHSKINDFFFIIELKAAAITYEIAEQNRLLRSQVKDELINVLKTTSISNLENLKMFVSSLDSLTRVTNELSRKSAVNFFF